MEVGIMNRPEKKFRAGAISATIWKNENQKGPKSFSYYTVALERAYKDQSGNWQSTSSMRLGDLPRAKLVLNKAYEYLVFQEDSVVEEQLVV